MPLSDFDLLAVLIALMYYKLSNTADLKSLEDEFGIQMRHAKLYKPAQVIHGLNEETILVITCENSDCMMPAIWGILPEEFLDDWCVFQNISNTLNLDESSFYNGSWCQPALKERRCLIVVTGFFTTYLHRGTIYPYYVKRDDNRPFCIAGIYNRLEDGFLTCSLITCKANGFISRIQNLGSQMPLILDDERRDYWLDQNLDEENIGKILKTPSENNLKAHLIAKEFFNQNITFESMLEPANYKDLPQALKA